jgi:hypothetical protein
MWYVTDMEENAMNEKKASLDILSLVIFNALLFLCSTVIFARSAEITGVLYDAGSNPVSGSSVLLMEINGASDFVDYTDRDGMFSFSNLNEGAYQLMIVPDNTKENYPVIYTSLAHDSRTNLIIRPEVKGRLHDLTIVLSNVTRSLAMEDVSLSISPGKMSISLDVLTFMQRYRTDEKGAVKVRSLSAGDYIAQIDISSSKPKLCHFEVGGDGSLRFLDNAYSKQEADELMKMTLIMEDSRINIDIPVRIQ